MPRRSTLLVFASLTLFVLVASAQEPPAVTVTGGKSKAALSTAAAQFSRGFPSRRLPWAIALA